MLTSIDMELSRNVIQNVKYETAIKQKIIQGEHKVFP